MLRLSVLDQSPIPSGATSVDALHATLDLAEATDRLGFHRYWLAEHHSFQALAGTAPEILISQVAARTTRIRVGSGGVMLPHYSALKVAESFRMLQALFGDRIDLGIGRAPGSDQLTAAALRSGGGPATAAQFPEQVAELLGFLHGTLPADHPFSRIRVMPVRPSTALQAVLPIRTISSGATSSIWRFKNGSIIAISSPDGSRFCGGRHGMTFVM